MEGIGLMSATLKNFLGYLNENTPYSNFSKVSILAQSFGLNVDPSMSF